MGKPTHVHALLVRFLAILVAIGGISLVGATPPAHAADPVTVTGSVVDDESGEGVGGASVEATSADWSDFAYTAADGGYTMALPPGLYEVYVTAEGYQAGFAQVEITEATTTIPLVELQPLPPTVTVSGTVVDATTGDGITDAYVEADGGEFNDYSFTDAGAFTLDLPPGLYELYVTADGYQDGSAEVEVTETAANLSPIELQPLPQMVSVSGTVVDSTTGAAISGADVMADGDDWGDSATADETGAYTMDLPVGSYQLSASADGYHQGGTAVEITETTTSLPPIRLDPRLPGIHVTVWNDTFGGVAANARVSLQPQGGGPATEKTTGSDGEASFTGLAEGAYQVEVLAGNGLLPAGDPVLVDYYAGEVSVVELAARADLRCEPAAAHQGLSNMGFENGLDGWTLGHQTESIQAVAADTFTAPWEGAAMARIGESRASDSSSQPQGPNLICQDFEVTEAEETFAFNVFTYDYTGFDEFSFDVVVTDPDSGETLAAYEQGAWGEGTELKTSGWRGVRLDLADHVGETVRLSFRAGGTADSLYAFWAYVDSAETLPPTIETDVTDVATETGSVTTDPTTGQVTVSMPAGDPSDLTMTVPGGCQDPAVTPSSVSLLLNGDAYDGTPAGDGLFQATIPEASVESGSLSVQVVCEGETTLVTPIGEIVLYDPSGIISDAVTGAPVVGAEVSLFKVPGWTPQDGTGPYPENSCQSNLSKPAGEPWGQPAPTDLGEPVNPASPEISPNVNPFVTNNIGYYGWDVAEGCWYVEVEAEGYQTLTSPVVGVPPEVTDLDLELQPTALANSEKPVILGTPKVGSTLTATSGTWSAEDAEYAYQWQRNGASIAGATAASYDVVPADVGKALTVEVTASKAGYASASATSDPVTGALGDAPVATTKPTISGTPKVGNTLTAASGTWDLEGASYAYQWRRDGAAIAGATGTTYAVVPADVGSALTLKVTVAKSGYHDGAATSDPVTGLQGDALVATTKPSISGTPKVGSTLTAAPGTWSPSGATFAHQWQRDGAPITGATAATYSVVPADVGRSLTVQVTAIKTGHRSGSATSAGVTGVLGTITAAKPRISGKPKVGKTLTAKAGTSDPSAVKVKYQWLRNGKAIKKASKTKYTLTTKDRGKKVSVRVTRTASGYQKLVLTSAPTKKIR